MNATIAILCTCPDEATAARLARGLLEQRQAACVNILPSVRSLYVWDDKLQDEQEALMIIKTTQAQFTAIEHWLQEHHPYDVPELLALEAGSVSGRYQAWLQSAVSR